MFLRSKYCFVFVYFLLFFRKFRETNSLILKYAFTLTHTGRIRFDNIFKKQTLGLRNAFFLYFKEQPRHSILIN